MMNNFATELFVDTPQQVGVFEVEISHSLNRLYVEVGGITVLINATEEGVITELMDEHSDEILQSMAEMYPEKED